MIQVIGRVSKSIEFIIPDVIPFRSTCIRLTTFPYESPACELNPLIEKCNSFS